MHCSRDICTLEDSYFEDTLIRTLQGVRWLYFVQDTLIRTLLSVRFL